MIYIYTEKLLNKFEVGQEENIAYNLKVYTSQNI